MEMYCKLRNADVKSRDTRSLSAILNNQELRELITETNADSRYFRLLEAKLFSSPYSPTTDVKSHHKRNNA